jgi:hypothetical protein
MANAYKNTAMLNTPSNNVVEVIQIITLLTSFVPFQLLTR